MVHSSLPSDALTCHPFASEFAQIMTEGITLAEGEYGRRAIFHVGWQDCMVDYLAMNNVAELELNWGKGWRGGSDLSFLAKLPNLKAFELFDFHIKVIEPIHYLHQLRMVQITTYCSSEIRFSEFAELGRPRA